MDARQYAASKSNGEHRGSAAGAGSGKRKGKGGRGGGGGKNKKPIKVVYIGNPIRVTTSEAGFRALVQELTGRHADPSMYSGGGAPSADVVDADDSSGGSPLGELHHQAGALPSPGSTVESSDAAATAAAGGGSGCHVPEPGYCGYGYDDDDEEDSFTPQLIDNRYCVFSPPTFL